MSISGINEDLDTSFSSPILEEPVLFPPKKTHVMYDIMKGIRNHEAVQKEIFITAKAQTEAMSERLFAIDQEKAKAEHQYKLFTDRKKPLKTILSIASYITAVALIILGIAAIVSAPLPGACMMIAGGTMLLNQILFDTHAYHRLAARHSPDPEDQEGIAVKIHLIGLAICSLLGISMGIVAGVGGALSTNLATAGKILGSASAIFGSGAKLAEAGLERQQLNTRATLKLLHGQETILKHRLKDQEDVISGSLDATRALEETAKHMIYK